MTPVLRAIVLFDDWLRGSAARRFALGVPLAVVVYVLGRHGLYLAVVAIVAATLLLTVVTVYGRRRLGMPAPPKLSR